MRIVGVLIPRGAAARVKAIADLEPADKSCRMRQLKRQNANDGLKRVLGFALDAVVVFVERIASQVTNRRVKAHNIITRLKLRREDRAKVIGAQRLQDRQ